MDKDFYKKIVALVIPMALQNLINVGVMASDVIMLGKAGETVLSGCSLAGQIYFILSLILFGITSGASVLIAQYWGKKDTVTIEKIIGIAMKLGILISFGFMIVTLVFPSAVMHIFSNEPAVIEEGTKFLKIIAFTYPMVAFTSVYLNLIKSIERVIISTIVYASSLCVNVIINAILIYGLFGAPALGIRGAAIGTLCARLLEIAIVLVYAIKKNKEVKIRLPYLIHADQVLVKDFMKYSGPVIINEMFWGLGSSANAAIVGHLGSSAAAANSVSQVARQLAMVIVFGIGNATAIMLGKAIGEGNIEKAQTYAKRFLKLSLLFGIAGGILIYSVSPFVIKGLEFSGQTAVYMKDFLFMMSFYAIAQSINAVCIVGIFRSGGDTKFGLIIDLTTMWLGSILFGVLAAFVFKWPVQIVYLILLCDEFMKVPLCLIRYKQKKWLNNVTR